MGIRSRMPIKENELSLLACRFSDARLVWNLALEQRNFWVLERAQKVAYNSRAHERIDT